MRKLISHMTVSLAMTPWISGDALAFTPSYTRCVRQRSLVHVPHVSATPFRRKLQRNMVSTVGDSSSYAVSFTTGNINHHHHHHHAPPSNSTTFLESTVVVSTILDAQLSASSITTATAAASATVVSSSQDLSSISASSSYASPFVNAVPSPASSLSVMQGRLIVLLSAAIFGTNFGCIKFLDGVLPLAACAAIRFSLAAAAVTAAVIMFSSNNKNNNNNNDHSNMVQDMANNFDNNNNNNDQQAFSSWQPQLTTISNHDQLEPWWRGGEVGLWYCVGYLSQAMGLHYVDASKSSFFNALAVLVVPLLDSLFKQKKMGWAGVASMITALGGVALLQMGPHLPIAAHAATVASVADHAVMTAATVAATSIASSTTTSFNSFSFLHPTTMMPWLSSLLDSGDLFCFGQAIFFGIGYWRLEEHSSKFPTAAGPITAGQLLAIAVGSIAYWVGTSTIGITTGGISASTASTLLDAASASMSQVGSWLSDPFTLFILAWTGLVSTAFALWLETVALSVVSATELTLLMTSVSLWGSLFAFLFMGETLSTTGMMGGFLILSGCVLTSLSKEQGEKEEQVPPA